MKPSARFSSLTHADINFVEKEKNGLVRASTKHLGAVVKASGCQSPMELEQTDFMHNGWIG